MQNAGYKEVFRNLAKKVGLISLGCPKNLVDSEVMMGLLRQGGYELTSDEQDADILIVNSCAFIETAKQESIDTIIELGRSKNHRKIVLTGCLAQRYVAQLATELPEVSAFVGTGEFHKIVNVCNLLVDKKQRKPLILVSSPQYLYDHLTPRILSTPKHYAYLKIAEGCDNRCSFCTIPQMRGVHRSRSLESLLVEAHNLAQSGVRELILISQDSTYYGVDLTGKRMLPALLKSLAQIDGIEWIRTLYAYPTLVDEKLLEVIAT
jgi:ribosomal protein S12 methylthiotransferase